jgi:RpiB/LacA/LacB family sugar-phosphate isomerase
MSKKYNLLLPIAGKAQRFIDQGYTMPKPLIMVKDKHVIDMAVGSIDITDCNLIFAVRLDHINNFSIDAILKQKFGEDIKIVIIDKVTDGSISTCLLAEDLINNDTPLIIYTPDVYFQDQFDPNSIDSELDGFILTFKANSPAHSYVSLDENNLALRTAEKEVISSNAAVGVYYYKTGKMFVEYAKETLDKNIRTNGEFYICPMYNLMIRDAKKVSIQTVKKMHVLGTPPELEFFVNHVIPKFGDKPIALASDHSGYEIKESAKKVLANNNIPYIDFGTYTNKNCDYNEYIQAAIRSLQNDDCDFGIGFCRTGQGVNILANSIDEIRCALVRDDYTAEYAISHNCANFFAVPSKYVTEDALDSMVKIWKTTTFDGGRHMTRMKKTIG